jgi:hypothetical protein
LEVLLGLHDGNTIEEEGLHALVNIGSEERINYCTKETRTEECKKIMRIQVHCATNLLEYPQVMIAIHHVVALHSLEYNMLPFSNDTHRLGGMKKRLLQEPHPGLKLAPPRHKHEIASRLSITPATARASNQIRTWRSYGLTYEGGYIRAGLAVGLFCAWAWARAFR